MTPDTMFWIASMTKAVTSTAAMQMVEQGKLSLDKPITDVVTRAQRRAGAGGFDADGKPKLPPAQAADHASPPADPHGEASATTCGTRTSSAT